MTKRNMEIFVKVAECENMSEAARKLYITQSSVSQVISDIEKEYSVLLFDRLSKGLHLTETGKTLLFLAKRVLEMESEMIEYLVEASPRPKIRVGATVTVGTCVISPILAEMRRMIPNLEDRVLVANTHILEEKLLCSELDICLVEGKIDNPELIVKPAINDEMVFICSKQHELYQKSQVSLQEVSKYPLIFREQGSGTRAQVEREFRIRNLPIMIKWDCYNTEAIVNGVIDNHGVSIISKRLVDNASHRDRLWMCPVQDADFRRSFDLVYHKDKVFSGAMQAMVDISLAFEKTAAPHDI